MTDGSDAAPLNVLPFKVPLRVVAGDVVVVVVVVPFTPFHDPVFVQADAMTTSSFTDDGGDVDDNVPVCCCCEKKNEALWNAAPADGWVERSGDTSYTTTVNERVRLERCC